MYSHFNAELVFFQFINAAMYNGYAQGIILITSRMPTC